MRTALKRDLVTSAIGMLVLTLFLGILYPLVITGVSQVAFPGNANGQQVHIGGHLVASKIIGQVFGDPVTKNGKPVLDKNGNPVTNPDPHFFQTRPSGTTPADNPAATTFANYGPNDKVTEQAIASNLQAYLSLERPYDPGLTVAKVPVDAVNTSASGVDPDISEANAAIQAHRVAAVDHLPLSRVRVLVSQNTSGRGLGFSGEPAVNVVELNLSLYRLGVR
jgi:K+-transporting ATPase ATPase C chain